MERIAAQLGALPPIPRDADDDIYAKVVKHHISTMVDLLKNPTTAQLVGSKGEYLLSVGCLRRTGWYTPLGAAG